MTVLAALAGTTILGGIGAVFYCWLKREKGTSGTEPPSKEERWNGKNYGRGTPQYGSYGTVPEVLFAFALVVWSCRMLGDG